MARTIDLRVADTAQALDRFEAGWNLLAAGGRLPPGRILSFADLPLLLRTLTPARWTLLERLAGDGPLSVRELARRLRRDYKNVHTDVRRLAELGLVERREHALVAVGWEAVHVELRLGN